MSNTQRSIVSVGQKHTKQANINKQTKRNEKIKHKKWILHKSVTLHVNKHQAVRKAISLVRGHQFFGVEPTEMKGSEREQYQLHIQFVRNMMRELIGEVYTAELPQITNVGSSAIGIIDLSLGWGTALSSAADFASYSALFDEFRIIAVRLSIQPYNKYSKTTTISRAIYYTHDNDGQAVIGSYDGIAQYPQHHESNTDDMFPKSNVLWRRPHVANSTLLGEMWTDLASASSSVGTTLIYADGLTASIQYGLANLTLFVQFKLAR